MWPAMQRSTIAWFLVGLGVLVGCAAEGGEADLAAADLLSTPLDAGPEDAAPSIKLPPPSNTTPEDAGGGDDGGGGGGGGTDGGTKTDAGADAGGGGGGGGGGGTCASPNTCVGATDLGSVSGDTGSGVKTAQGSGSQWFKIRVSEDDSGVTGVSLAIKATLVSPAGTNFDLYTYLAGSGTGHECSAVKKSSTTTGTDIASFEFGESGLFSNGSDDDRTVTIEVRHVSGTCAPGAKWTLTVNGNQL